MAHRFKEVLKHTVIAYTLLLKAFNALFPSFSIFFQLPICQKGAGTVKISEDAVEHCLKGTVS
jgi:hypothetical protein